MEIKMTKLLIGMTGTLGMLSIPSYLFVLSQHFQNIKIIMTYSATQFIPYRSLSMFSNGIYTREFPLSQDNMSHIELARWAELFIVLPATAHIISQSAHGFADSLLSTTILAYERKVIFFPNMNSSLWRSKALQRNIALLKEMGHSVIDPIEKPAFEYASRQIEVNHVLPSIDSVLSILQLETELNL